MVSGSRDQVESDNSNPKEIPVMANTIPVGSDVSSGTYRCTNCSYELGVQSVTSLPPCPECDGPYAWEALMGGDAADDPYPDGSSKA